MAGWVKLDKFKIVERRGGAVYKTKKVGSEWFPISAQPKTDVEDKDGYVWASTLDYHFGPTRPTEK